MKEINYYNLLEFVQNLIKDKYIDYKTTDGYIALVKEIENAIFLNYITNIDLVLFRQFLQQKNSQHYSLDEVKDIINNIDLNFLQRFSYVDEKGLSMVDNANIYRNFYYLTELENKGIKFSLNESISRDYYHVKEYDIAYFTNLYTILKNILDKQKYDELGLNEYINIIHNRFFIKDKNSAYIRQKTDE